MHFSRVQVYGGKKDTWTLDAMTDGQKEVVQHLPLYTSHIRVYWEGDALVLDEKITAGDGTQASNKVKYTVSGDGNLLTTNAHVLPPDSRSFRDRPLRETGEMQRGSKWPPVRLVRPARARGPAAVQ